MTKSKQAYPTDLNDTEWVQIAPYLPEAKSTGRPREIPWREIMNGMFYMVKNGFFKKAYYGRISIRSYENVCV